MLTRTKLLAAFAAQPTDLLSGTHFARQTGVTRAAVWKAATALQAEGYPIERHGRKGYGFDRGFDLSLFQWSQTPTSLAGHRFHYQSATASTQRSAKQAATVGAPDGSLWAAEMQTAGRGRLDRPWNAGWGGLWFSLLLRPRLPTTRVPPLTLVAALVLCRTLRAVTGLKLFLKWPNDIVIGQPHGRWRKVAGLLTELAGDIDRTHWVVIGIGLNVHNQLPPALRAMAASLQELTGKRWNRAALLRGFLQCFGTDRQRFEQEGFSPFREEYWKLYSRPDGEMTLRTARGDIRGRARGVDASGAIIIESRRQMRHFSEGEIVL